REPQRQDLLPGKREELHRVPTAAPGAVRVAEPARAEHAHDFEGRPRGEQSVAEPAELRLREGEQSRLAEVVGPVAGHDVREGVAEVVAEELAVAVPTAQRIHRRQRAVALPAQLDLVLQLEQARGAEAVAREIVEIRAAETVRSHALERRAVGERRLERRLLA